MNTDAVTLSEKKEQDLGSKKRYERPKLETYGSIRELTKTLGIFDQDDGSIIPGLNMTDILA